MIIASVSLNSGDIYIFESKQNNNRYSDKFKYISNISVGKAVRASCSFPGVFCPVHTKNDILMDGGVRENILWKELKNRAADKVICIVFEEKEKIKEDKNIIDSVSGAISLMGRELSNYELNGADIVFKINTREVSLLDFSKIDYLYQQGYIQTKKYINKYLIENN